MHRNLIPPWLGLRSGSRAMHDAELRPAGERAGCRYRGPAAGSPSRLSLGFAASLLDSPSGCRHPPDPAPKTPESLFGPLLSQLVLSVPGSQLQTPSPTFLLPARTHSTTVPRKANTARTHQATCRNSASCHSALLPRPHPHSQAPRELWLPLLPSPSWFFREKDPGSGHHPFRMTRAHPSQGLSL